jgi:hypothetical protein
MANARNPFKLWMNFVKKTVELLEWFYHNSMLSAESFTSRLLGGWKFPLKIVIMIPLWMIEWIISGSLLLSGAFFSAMAAFSPFLVIMSIFKLFSASSLADIGKTVLILVQILFYLIGPCVLILYAIHLLRKHFDENRMKLICLDCKHRWTIKSRKHLLTSKCPKCSSEKFTSAEAYDSNKASNWNKKN